MPVRNEQKYKKVIRMFEGKAKEIMANAMSERYHGNYGGSLIRLRELTNSLSPFGVIGDEWAKLLLGEVMHQFGVTYQNMKDWPTAFDYLSIAACYRSSIGDLIGRAYTFFQIPMCRLARGDKVEDVMPDFERAEEAINMAIPGAVEADDYKTLGNMYQNLAYTSQQKRDLRQAINLYHETLGYRKIVKDRRGEGLTLARMAECYKELGGMSISDAKIHAKGALEIFQEIGDVNRIKQVEKVLREIEEIEAEMRE